MAVHFYGVVSAGTSLPSTVRGRNDAPLRTIEVGDVAAIVSDVDVEARIRRADLMAHAHVLDAIVEDTTVLPMRFGILVDSDEEVAEQVLRPAETRLVSLLEEFHGLQQLTIKVSHDEDEVLRHLLAERPDVRELRDSIGIRDDHMYGRKLHLGQVVAEGVEAIGRADAAMLIDELTPLAHDVSVEEPTQQQVLQIALLVRRSDRPRVDAAIKNLSQKLPSRLRLRYVGPQPPYAFIDTATASEPAWA
ncbi:MAG: GvpL/GvpF family gas vesicle protein [Nocardioidaceae bacterium]